MQMRRFVIAMFCMLPIAAMLYGCGSSKKEGSGSLADVATVSEASCAQCHSGKLESLTGNDIYSDYNASTHSIKNVGCQGCHGGGSQHNGIGPLPYPDPTQARCVQCHTADASYAKVVTSKHGAGELELAATCNRCHTHEGAVRAMKSGFTGDKDTLTANVALAPGALTEGQAHNIKCDTCHKSHKPDDLRTVTGWTPSTTVGAATASSNAQFIMCTSCHSYTKADGTLIASGNTVNTIPSVKFEHETAWYRIIPSTHFDNPTTTSTIEGYVLRTKGPNSTNPCFDCHNHEATTNTGNLTRNSAGKYVLNTELATTIYTDWASSGHAGKLLTAKYAAQDAYPKKSDGTYDRSVGMTDAVMAAGVTTTSGYAWVSHGGDAASSCNQCHTATGAANYLSSPSTYNYASNDFTHRASGQREVLYCWGCHTNAGKGTVYTPGAISMTIAGGSSYTMTSYTVTFPNVGSTNICISCHSGRNFGKTINDATFTNSLTNDSLVTPHHATAAGTMYVKSGFTAFIDPATAIGTSTYGASLTSSEDGGALTSTHRKLGTTSINGDSHNPSFFVAGNLDSGGPCVVCHMSSKNGKKGHSLTIDGNAFTEVCSKCHSSEGTTTLTAANFKTVFVEEQAVPYKNGLALAAQLLETKYKIYVSKNTDGNYTYSTFADTAGGTSSTKNWVRASVTGVTQLSTADAKKLMGAAYNLYLLGNADQAAYVHARTYARRLLYDTIDFLDDGVINLSVGATALATLPAVYIKDTTAGGTTTESMKYLLSYDRTTLAWKNPERP